MNGENPLWMPKGSVRASIAVGLVASCIYTAITGDVPQILGTLTGVVVAFYFKTREGSP